jgi:hypothetical protein
MKQLEFPVLFRWCGRNQLEFRHLLSRNLAGIIWSQELEPYLPSSALSCGPYLETLDGEEILHPQY